MRLIRHNLENRVVDTDMFVQLGARVLPARGFRHTGVLDLHGFNDLAKITRVAFDMNGIAHGQIPIRQLNRTNANMPEIMRDGDRSWFPP